MGLERDTRNTINAPGIFSAAIACFAIVVNTECQDIISEKYYGARIAFIVASFDRDVQKTTPGRGQSESGSECAESDETGTEIEFPIPLMLNPVSYAHIPRPTR